MASKRCIHLKPVLPDIRSLFRTAGGNLTTTFADLLILVPHYSRHFTSSELLNVFSDVLISLNIIEYSEDGG